MTEHDANIRDSIFADACSKPTATKAILMEGE